jgi:hypothetical protein
VLVVLLSLPNGSIGAPNVAFVPETTIGADDGSAPLLALPTSAVVAQDGSIFVSDLRAQAVFHFSGEGSFIEQFGQAGDGPGDVMFGAQIAMTPDGHIAMAGMTGRVDFMDTRWNYSRSLERQHASDMCRGLVFLPDGSLVISAADIIEQTAFDLYDQRLEYIGSYGETFASGTEIDWRFESAHAGGYVDAGPDRRIYYLQLVPFELSRFTATGELERSTTDLGRDFVPDPPRPEIQGDRLRVTYPWQTTGLVVLESGFVVATAYHRHDDGATTSKAFVYDLDLDPIGEIEFEGTVSVIGRDADGRIFVWVDSDDKLELSRGRLLVSPN